MTKLTCLIVLFLVGCAHFEPSRGGPSGPSRSGTLAVNGTDLYYEIWGTSGEPVVLMHGGGSDMEVSFGKALAELPRRGFQVIAIDEQGHGKSPASARPFGFVQTADDIAALLPMLGFTSASFVGFSNGATTGLELAMRHPSSVRRLVLGSGVYARDGVPQGFWDGFKGATLESMPKELRDAYVKRSPWPQDLPKMFAYDSQRMKNFKDIPDADIRRVNAPILIMQTDHDVPTLEHGLKMVRLLPNARFAVFPGPHDNFLGSVSHTTPEKTAASLAIITEFLKDASDGPK